MHLKEVWILNKNFGTVLEITKLFGKTKKKNKFFKVYGLRALKKI